MADPLDLSEATRRLVRTADGLSDDQYAEPSALPGWTRAHVLAHLALNAEGLAGALTGIVEGERVERIMAAKAESLGTSKKEIRDRMVEGVSLKTTVTAQDVANTALFLVSDAGKHISGQAISVCGGVRYMV